MNNTFEVPLQERIQGLPPTIDKHSAVLILGTLPGQMSLAHGKYYADPSNKFWDILFIACGEEIDKSAQAKEALLKKYNIALWDILDSAVRETSSDKDLMDEKPNDLPQLLEEYPNIKLLLFHNQPVHFHDIKNEGNPAVLCQEKTSKTEWWYMAASEKQHQRAIYNHPPQNLSMQSLCLQSTCLN